MSNARRVQSALPSLTRSGSEWRELAKGSSAHRRRRSHCPPVRRGFVHAAHTEPVAVAAGDGAHVKAFERRWAHPSIHADCASLTRQLELDADAVADLLHALRPGIGVQRTAREVDLSGPDRLRLRHNQGDMDRDCQQDLQQQGQEDLLARRGHATMTFCRGHTECWGNGDVMPAASRVGFRR